uniref:Heterokaryon incompatibility domain-containing protein n=1 Tax=Physcomitrium patens TaxID=3218 RepID=A0A7I4AEB5_PHYPA
MIRFEFGKLGKRRVLTTSGNGELVIRPLGPKEPYVAISHIWGGNTNTIKGIKWKVATWMSLERCKALVKSYDCVWIDSLCIDQVHGEDKHAQIKNMHKIYEDAEYVAVVLTGDYGRQLTSLRRLTELLIDLKSLGRECVCQKVRDIVNLMTPINLNWYKDTKRLKERRRCLEYTAYRVFKQLHKRDCKFIHDRVYGVCALLGIKISRVDYKREYEDVFIEAVKKLVERGVCALPLRPQLVHGNTWLPSLKDVDLKDAWKLVKSTCAMNEEEDSYHNLVCEGDRVYATGGLVQMVNPFKLRTSMETIGKILQDFVEAVHVEKDFDPVGSIQDPALLTITCVVLWMFRNRGNDAEVTTRDVDTVILSVYNNKKSADEVESSKDKNRCNILEEFGIAASDIKWHLDTQKLTTSQVVANILEACALVPLEDNSAHKIASLVDRDAILVVKKKLGFVLCSVPSSVQSSYDTYGFFYKSSLGVRVREISCNVLVLNGDDVWDNYGDALCWYIGRVRNICKRRICVGTIH